MAGKEYTTAPILVNADGHPIPQYLDITDTTDSPQGTFKPLTQLQAERPDVQNVQLTGSIVKIDHPFANGSIGVEVAPGESVEIYSNKDFTHGKSIEWWMTFMAQFDAEVVIFWSHRSLSLPSSGGRLFHKVFDKNDDDMEVGEGDAPYSGDTYFLKNQNVLGNYLLLSIRNGGDTAGLLRNVMFFEKQPKGES